MEKAYKARVHLLLSNIDLHIHSQSLSLSKFAITSFRARTASSVETVVRFEFSICCSTCLGYRSRNN